MLMPRQPSLCFAASFLHYSNLTLFIIIQHIHILYSKEVNPCLLSSHVDPGVRSELPVDQLVWPGSTNPHPHTLHGHDGGGQDSQSHGDDPQETELRIHQRHQGCLRWIRLFLLDEGTYLWPTSSPTLPHAQSHQMLSGLQHGIASPCLLDLNQHDNELVLICDIVSSIDSWIHTIIQFLTSLFLAYFVMLWLKEHMMTSLQRVVIVTSLSLGTLRTVARVSRKTSIQSTSHLSPISLFFCHILSIILFFPFLVHNNK